MNNKEKIKKIIKWQQSKFFHHLICSKEKCEGVLSPIEINKEVVLECPICKNIQKHIPQVIFNSLDMEKLDGSINDIIKELKKEKNN